MEQRKRKNPDAKPFCITGEAGVGKTRLATEIVKHPEFADANVLQIHCHDIFASTPLYSVGMFRLVGGGSDRRRRQDYSRSEDREFSRQSRDSKNPENEDIINSLIGTSLTSATEASAPTPFLFKRKQFALLGSIFEQMVRKQPTLIWVDDVHWIDPSSAELLQELVKPSGKNGGSGGADRPILSKSPNLPSTDNVIELGQLNCRRVLQNWHAPSRARRICRMRSSTRAVEAADGIPLFVEYLVLSLVDQKEQASNASRRRGDLPLTLAAMISERLDRVADGRRVVQAAACIGRALYRRFPGCAAAGKCAATLLSPSRRLIDAEILRSNH